MDCLDDSREVRQQLLQDNYPGYLFPDSHSYCTHLGQILLDINSRQKPQHCAKKTSQNQLRVNSKTLIIVLHRKSSSDYICR